MDNCIHRASQWKYSLCGIKCEPSEMTIYDERVTCEECKNKLCIIYYADTKTDIIAKIRLKKEEPK